MATKARKYVLRSHFSGLPKREDLEIVEETLPPVKDGGTLTMNDCNCCFKALQETCAVHSRYAPYTFIIDGHIIIIRWPYAVIPSFVDSI